MSEKFDASSFHDTYKQKLLTVIEARAHGKPLPKGKAKAPAATNVVNIMDVLQRSLEERKGKRAATNGKRAGKRAKRELVASAS